MHQRHQGFYALLYALQGFELAKGPFRSDFAISCIACAAYVLLGWLVIQVTDTVSPALSLPDWTLGLVTWLGIIGLPFALFFAWAFELTPDGIKRESDSTESNSGDGATTRALDIALVVLLVVTIGLIAWSSISDEANYSTNTRVKFSRTSGQVDIPAFEVADFDSDGIQDMLLQSDVDELGFYRGLPGDEVFAKLTAQVKVKLPT